MTVFAFTRDASVRTIALSATVCALSTIMGCKAPAKKEPPRLAVILVVDMLPARDFDRFAKHFGDGGFKRFMNDGAWFADAHFSYATPSTGPGHATIATGTVPSKHGIVHNRWFEPGSIKPVNCVADDSMFVTGTARTAKVIAASAHRLVAGTVADRLKDQYGQDAKVWSGSLKDRSAVLLGGHNPDGAIWWSQHAGDFMSSSKSLAELPPWCESLNEERFIDRFFDKAWDRALPEEAYAECDEDDVPYEHGRVVLWNNKLPKRFDKMFIKEHPGYYQRLRASPFGNELVFEWARRAVVNESLGADDTPDLLCISLSSTDVVGHFFGINSHEMLDMMVRTDRQIADWLTFLDEKVGLQNCSIVLTGDHGTGMTPEYAQKQGLGGGRVDVNDLFYKADNALRAKFGQLEDGVYYLTAVDLPWMYLNDTTLTDKGVDRAEAEELVAKVTRENEGIESVVVASKLSGRPAESLSPLERAVVNNIYPGRNGEVYIQLKPNWYKNGICGGHDTAHACDTHVPLFFLGKGFRKGRHAERVEMCDLAPTISAALAMPPPANATGKVLRKAIK